MSAGQAINQHRTDRDTCFELEILSKLPVQPQGDHEASKQKGAL